MIEKSFDIPFVAGLALREKQSQQNYRPVIAVHKWFARRPGSLFRALLLSEFVGGRLSTQYYLPHSLKGLRVADPFMGGGTPLLEANRLGCDIIGYDINPMAYWIVRQEIAHLDLIAYREAAAGLMAELEHRIGRYYRTRCLHCGSADAHVKYFLWVKTQDCISCGSPLDLFPGYLVAENRRHPRHVLVCPECGELVEVEDHRRPGLCTSCHAELREAGPASRGNARCPRCGAENIYPSQQPGPPQHRMFAIEYYCPGCKPAHQGRFFKKPDDLDLARYTEAESEQSRTPPTFVPQDPIPQGDETNRLHRWGYRQYKEMFNSRQLLGLELSCKLIAQIADREVREALATNLSDLLRYQNMLCRYDTGALKSLDIFSVHGFPVGLVQCESNLIGIPDETGSTNVGSGGWSNVVEKFARAKAYCERPFEVAARGNRKSLIFVPSEWIGEARNGRQQLDRRRVSLHCHSATKAAIPPASLDAVMTDPPYFGNVQYAELMDFCYVWLRQLVGSTLPAFRAESTRNADELTGNATMDRGLTHFAEGLSEVLRRMAAGLKPGAPLVFTYHHNSIEAYLPVAVAILDAQLVCTASLPCPAEMGASIHINGTSSSIVDTIFVCRSTGKVPRHWVSDNAEEVASLVSHDIAALQAGGMQPTRGDIHCLIAGHLIRLAVWTLRHTWRKEAGTDAKLALVRQYIQGMGGVQRAEQLLGEQLQKAPEVRVSMVREVPPAYGEGIDELSF